MGRAAPGVPTAGPVYRFAAWVAFTIFRLQRWRFDVDGLDRVPRAGGAVVVANHCSFWDFFTVGKPGYEQFGRPVRILAKESLFRVPVFGWLMRRARHIPVHRGSGADALRSAVDALEAGELVLVLPEQTISRSFELLPFKNGAARMAIAAGVPIVPAATWGSQRFHTVGRRPRWSWRLPVLVRFGDPVVPTPGADPESVTAELQRRVEVLLHQAQDEYPEVPAPGDEWWQPARLGGSAPTHDEALAEREAMRRRWSRRRAA